MLRKFPNKLVISNTFALLFALGGSIGIASSASAQLYGPGTFSLITYAVVDAGDISAENPNIISSLPFASLYSSVGNFVSTSGSQSFTGKDSQGDTQTMIHSGSASALAYFGELHASAQGTVVNPYYNATNDRYYTGVTSGVADHPDGSPQYLGAAGVALFEDSLSFLPSDGVVGLRYHFHLDGNLVDTDHSYAYLLYSANENTAAFSTDATFNNFVDWVTPTWSVTAGRPIHLSGNFGAAVLVNTKRNDTVEGVTISGAANFSNTLTLTGIDLLDANGNLLTGATYLTASGARYNIAGASYAVSSSAVPEPGAVALMLGMTVSGGVLFLRRRRRK